MKQIFSAETLKKEYLCPQAVIQSFNDDVITSSGDGDCVEDWWEVPKTTNTFLP